MKKTELSKHDKRTGGAVLVGVGLAALAAAAAGTYYLYGSKDATKHQRKIKGWMLQAKGEILERIESVKNIDEGIYNKIVNEVSDRYKKIKKIDIKEMSDFRSELSNYWAHIKKDIDAVVEGPVKKSRKASARSK
jgi:hypothetical protein